MALSTLLRLSGIKAANYIVFPKTANQSQAYKNVKNNTTLPWKSKIWQPLGYERRISCFGMRPIRPHLLIFFSNSDYSTQKMAADWRKNEDLFQKTRDEQYLTEWTVSDSLREKFPVLCLELSGRDLQPELLAAVVDASVEKLKRENMWHCIIA